MIFNNISNAQGLGDPLVQAIHQDGRGMVWLGTASTLECFDGVHLFTTAIPGELAVRKRVQAIASDNLINIWIGNGDGLWCIPHDGISLQPVERERLNAGVNAIIAGEDQLFIASNKGLYIYRPSSGTLEHHPVHVNELAPMNVLTGLCRLPDGELWATSQSGICRFSPSDGKWQVFQYPDNPQQGFRHLVQAGTKLFLGTLDNGLFVFDMSSQTFSKGPDLRCQVVYDLTLGADGLLYAGTDGNGVFGIDTGSGRIVSHLYHSTGKKGISSNAVYSLHTGKNGQLWIGFYQHGFDYSLFQSGQIDVWPGTEGLAVRAFAKHGQQYLIGCREGLLFRDGSDGRSITFSPDDLNSHIVFSLLWHDGLFYVGTYGGGLYTFDTSTLRLEHVPGFSEREIFCLTEDGSGNLWVAAGGGAYCFSAGKQILAFTSANSPLPGGNVYEIFFDSTSRGWVCTDNGVCIYDPFSKLLRTDVFPENFNSQEKIRNIYEDSAHRLYFVPDKGDILVSDLTLTNVSSLTAKTPMEGLDGRFVTQDADGKLWIGTQRGLFSVDRQQNVRRFNFSNGLPDPSFTLCKPLTDDARLWMGNEAGLLYIDRYSGVIRLASDSAHCVSGLLADGKKMAISYDDLYLKERVELPVQPDEMTILLTEFTYTKPDCMNYEYRMDRTDDGWQLLEGASEVKYHELGWGKHTFHIRNCSDPRVEHTLVISIPMNVDNWLRLCGIGVGILVLIWLAGRIYRKRDTLLLLLARPEPASQEKSADDMPLPEDEPSDMEIDESGEQLTVADSDKYRNVNMSEEESRHLISELERCMKQEKLFTQQNLKLSDVAERMGTTPYLLSYILSQHIQVSYYDYVNGFRVEEFKSLAKTSEMGLYTLTALAEKCGFNSRASFFRYFKKVTGQTPSEWCREMGVGE